jgi:hypothetical protein
LKEYTVSIASISIYFLLKISKLDDLSKEFIESFIPLSLLKFILTTESLSEFHETCWNFYITASRKGREFKEEDIKFVVAKFQLLNVKSFELAYLLLSKNFKFKLAENISEKCLNIIKDSNKPSTDVKVLEWMMKCFYQIVMFHPNISNTLITNEKAIRLFLTIVNAKKWNSEVLKYAVKNISLFFINWVSEKKEKVLKEILPNIFKLYEIGEPDLSFEISVSISFITRKNGFNFYFLKIEQKSFIMN